MIILQFRFLQYSFRVAHIRTNCDCDCVFLFLVFLQFNHEIDTSIFDHAFVFVILINDVQSFRISGKVRVFQNHNFDKYFWAVFQEEIQKAKLVINSFCF